MFFAAIRIDAFDKFDGPNHSSLTVHVTEGTRPRLTAETSKIAEGAVLLTSILGPKFEKAFDEFEAEWGAARDIPFNPEGDAASATVQLEVSEQQLDQLRQLSEPFTVREL